MYNEINEPQMSTANPAAHIRRGDIGHLGAGLALVNTVILVRPGLGEDN